MRAFIFFASAALLALGCGQTQNLGGGDGPGPDYDPCSGKACGDACSLCAPGDADCVETADIKVCNVGGACGSADPQCAAQCSYNGAMYPVGGTFPSDDGCNTCSCLEDGSVVCTEKACAVECGGIGGIPCGDGEYCDYAGGMCGNGDDLGSCLPIPQACDAIFDPVCGCDGVTYGNACEAALASASVAHDGSCDTECAGFGGGVCSDGAYCRIPDGTCEVIDQGGTCEPIPQGCPDNVDPVCGCDGVTYFNACEAAAAGVSLSHAGACADPIVCGGLGGMTCQAGDYCKFPDNTCNADDTPGVCEVIPQGCPDNLDPVCGCDGVTYGNPCEAAAVSMSIAHTGVCP